MKVTEWRLGWVLLVTLGAMLTKTNVTFADEPRYRVELHAPKYLPNCNDHQGFVSELDLALGHSLLDEANASRVLDVRIDRPIGSDYAVNVVIRGVDSSLVRETTLRFSGSMECFKVFHKVAFAAAIEMEKDVPDEPKDLPPPTQTCKPPPAVPLRCPEPVAPPPQVVKAIPRPRGFVGVGLGAYLNVAPEAFFAPHVRVGWYARPRAMLELDVAGQAWMTTTPRDGLTNIAVKTGIATLAGCYAPQTFLLCGLFSAELRHTSNREQVPETKLLPSIGVRAGYDHPLGRSFLLRTSVDVFVYLRGRTIDTRASTLWTPMPLATNLTTSLVWTF